MKRHVLLHIRVLLALLWVVNAPAADGVETYFVVPSLGPAHLVFARPLTGSNLDRNLDRVLPPLGDALDDGVFATVQRTIKQRDANADVVRVRLSGGMLFQEADEPSDAANIAELRKVLRDAHPVAPGAKAIVIAAHRAPARMQGQNTTYGAGNVSGIGFYIDRMTGMRRSDTGESGRGFLGWFTNVRLPLIDLDSGRILGDERGTTGTTRAAVRGENENPWEAVPNDQKLEIMRSIVGNEIRRMLPMLLAKMP